MKKIVLTIVVIAVGLGLFSYSACGIFYYTISGTWTMVKVVDGISETTTITFRGGRKGGDVVWNDFYMGFYEYENSVLEFSMSYGDNVGYEKTGSEQYTGGFDDEDLTSGTFTGNYQGPVVSTVTGTWTATRNN
jgi:hypothetical protein